MTTRHQPTAAVRESFGQAQQQAAAMVAGPPAPWNEATRTSRRAPRWIGLAAVSVVAGGVAGWFGVDGSGGSTRAGSTASADAGARSVGPAPAASLPAPVPAMLQATTPAPMAAAPASLSVTRESGVIRIASTNASLTEAVRALAQATHTTVKGGEALASIADPITLHWQGKDTAAAWDALLGRFASIAVSCSGAACELWIVGTNARPAARAAAISSVDASTAPSEPLQPARPVVQVQAPPPSSDEDTETN